MAPAKDRVQELKAMHDEGLINEEEFNKKKTEILESSNPNAALAMFANTPPEKEFAIHNCSYKFWCGCTAYQKIKLYKDDIELEETTPCPWPWLGIPACLAIPTCGFSLFALLITVPLFLCSMGKKLVTRKPYSNFGRPYGAYSVKRHLHQLEEVGLRQLEDVELEYDKLGCLDAICDQGDTGAVKGILSVRAASTLPDLSSFGNKKQGFKGQKIMFEGPKAKMLEMCSEISKRIAFARNKERNEVLSV
jgi:hypothetical protein